MKEDYLMNFLVMCLCFLIGYNFKESVNITSVDVHRSSLERDDPATTTTTHTITAGAAHVPTCSDFFTVLADVWADSEKNCTSLYKSYQEQLEVHDSAMGKMGSTFTVFTTWSEEELKDPQCGHYFDYLNHTRFQQFDPEDLLIRHGFSAQQIIWMMNWQNSVPRLKHALTRLSDVFRIVLQKEHRMAYADLDVVYLMDDKRVYLDVPNVAVPVWNEEMGALEIQNSAFCFNQAQLTILINNIKAMMDKRGDDQMKHNRYLYTGMGPNLFQHSLQAMTAAGPLHMYMTHSDDHFKWEDIEKLHRHYDKFVWLHLDGSIRRRNRYRHKDKNYKQLVEMMMEQCQPPRVEDVLPKYVLEATTSGAAAEVEKQ